MFCNNFVDKLNGYYLLVELNRPFYVFKISLELLVLTQMNDN